MQWQQGFAAIASNVGENNGRSLPRLANYYYQQANDEEERKTKSPGETGDLQTMG
ncbi:MAG: hypothetical protein MUF62_14315 [Chitinophagaceae bacterium]|jgi:hypothetical protein|nr:hypothetical protein [Chitinophagaceae bacterium]